MNKDYPLVSVIIPTYNREKMVGKAIQSALSQTYPNKEIIVVDDGSTDNTEALVRTFENVRFIAQEHRGQASARNNGWKNSKGKYIASLDSDDFWEGNFLMECVSTLEKLELDFVFTNWNQESLDGDYEDCFSTYPFLKTLLPIGTNNSWVLLEHSQVREIYIEGCPSPSSSLVIRASSLTLGWNEEIHIADDWCMLLDIIFSKKIKVAFTTQQLWSKKINCDNIYDGRNVVEVNKLLWVNDTSTILARYEKLLTKKEKKFLERRYLQSLVLSAKHSFFLDGIGESLKIVHQAMYRNPTYTAHLFLRKTLSYLTNVRRKTQPLD